MVTSALPPFLALPPSLEPKRSPHPVTPHQCCITHCRTAPDLHPRCHTERAHSSGLGSKPVVPVERSASCRVPGQVPHCVCQAVCPLPCCISTFPDDGQEALQELPQIGTLGSMARLPPMGRWMGIGRRASTRVPNHPTTPPRASQRNLV